VIVLMITKLTVMLLALVNVISLALGVLHIDSLVTFNVKRSTYPFLYDYLE